MTIESDASTSSLPSDEWLIYTHLNLHSCTLLWFECKSEIHFGLNRLIPIFCRYTSAEKKKATLSKKDQKGVKVQELDKLKQDQDLTLSYYDRGLQPTIAPSQASQQTTIVIDLPRSQ